MALPSLFNVPGTSIETAQWAFSHMANHRDIIARIALLADIQLQEYALDPMNPDDLGPWLYQHQQMHQDMDALLGISGYDLLDVDWKDQRELAGWIFLNADEHRQACNILEIS